MSDSAGKTVRTDLPWLAASRPHLRIATYDFGNTHNKRSVQISQSGNSAENSRLVSRRVVRAISVSSATEAARVIPRKLVQRVKGSCHGLHRYVETSESVSVNSR